MTLANGSEAERLSNGGSERGLHEGFVDDQVDDAIHTQMTMHYTDNVILGIGLLAGSYLGLARLLEDLEVEPEQKFGGWDLENL